MLTAVGGIPEILNLVQIVSLVCLGWISAGEPNEKERKEEKRAAQQKDKEEKHFQKEFKKIKRNYGDTTILVQIPCGGKECKKAAAEISFNIPPKEIQLSASICYTLKSDDPTTITRSHKFSESEFTRLFLLAKKRDWTELDNRLQEVFEDGIKNFCRQCNAAYCGYHHETWPVYEEDGWYDCTDLICPRGHKNLIDD